MQPPEAKPPQNDTLFLSFFKSHAPFLVHGFWYNSLAKKKEKGGFFHDFL